MFYCNNIIDSALVRLEVALSVPNKRQPARNSKSRPSYLCTETILMNDLFFIVIDHL